MFLLLLILLASEKTSSLSPSAILGTLTNIPEDGIYNFTQIAAKYGHPAEEHRVITEDGYILALFHLPGPGQPVLMSHGVFDSADGFIVRGNTSLAVMIAREGYDVWLLNNRGCRYSRKHVTLDPDADAKFWDYSANEFGHYDLPATIDYVLNATGEPQLSLIGFSEGTTSGYVLGATRPEYNKKIKVFICLAPIAFLQHTVGPLTALIQLGPFLNAVIPAFVNEIGGYFSLSKALINLFCTQLIIGYDVCFGIGVNPLIGPDIEAIEREFFKVIVGHFPAGTSKKNLIHFSQIGLRGVFAAYDYGAVKNLEVYGSFVPPSYDLSEVSMPIYLLSGTNDRVSTVADVKTLYEKLPNVKEWKVLDSPRFNHLDHLWAIDAHEIEYPYVLNTLAMYN